MQRSTDRILTTHAGSLPMPADLHAMLRAREAGQPYDAPALQTRLTRAVAEVVQQQAEHGLDILSDGEQSKTSFTTYVSERLSGLETRPGAVARAVSDRQRHDFPEYFAAQRPAAGVGRRQFYCIGPLQYTGQAALQTDIANLQIDDPRLVSYYMMHPERSVADCRRWAAQRVAAINDAIRDIPPAQVRFHTCYSIDVGPRIHDMAVQDIVDILLQINARAYSFEAANPRHEHEYHVFEQVKLPEGKVLIPGVISHTTNLIEHPALIAERIVRFARLVGRENVIAGADCGFAASAVRFNDTHPSVAWLKFAALAEGARLATRQLW